MGLASIDLFHILAAIAALLAAAHAGGLVAIKFRLPPMVGELVGGLLLGATVFKRVLPDASEWLLPAIPTEGVIPPVLPVLGFCSQLGLLLLMFTGGLQMRRLLTRTDLRAISWIAGLGVAIPVLAGIAIVTVEDFESYAGPAHSLTALHIVLITALAVTSIPVITRIFMDLGLMETRLARVVLSVAVVEDVLLYIAVSLAVGMAGADSKEDASIPTYLNMDPNGIPYVLWHIAASLVLLVIASTGVRWMSRHRPEKSKWNLVLRRSPLAYSLAILFVVVLVSMLLGLAPIFGALVAGIAASGDTRPKLVAAREQIVTFATATFIPIYFAFIGVTLDLIDDLDWKFTVGLFVVGTAVKYGSSLLGARLAGEEVAMAQALAISVNARGGPGIVLATTALGAGIITPDTFTALIILALGTSVLAGSWLSLMLRTNPRMAELIRRSESSDPPQETARAAE